jgi:hypothetical protein
MPAVHVEYYIAAPPHPTDSMKLSNSITISANYFLFKIPLRLFPDATIFVGLKIALLLEQ